MAGITLTEWWKAFSNDLENLAPKVTNADSVQWNAARTMIEAGSQIEGNFLWGLSYANTINTASRSLGAAYENRLTKKATYLPDITSPELLLFALVYYRHLCRYELISEGRALIVNQLINGRAEIADMATELHSRIESYCSDPENILQVEQEFPEIASQEAPTFLEKIKKWCAEEPLITKLSKQLEEETQRIIEAHNTQQKLSTLCNNIERLLEDKIKIFRRIAAYKQMIELLKSGVLSSADLQNHQTLKDAYPEHWERWSALNDLIPHKTMQEARRVDRKTALIGAVIYTGGIVNSLTRWTLGFVTPAFISGPVSSLANTVSDFTHALLPTPFAEQRKQSLIDLAEKKIIKQINKLNKNGAQQLTAQDFAELNAAGIGDLADKIQLIHKLVSLCKCLSVYEKQNTTSYIKFSLSLIFKPLTYFMSQTFLRHLLFDKVLYILEAKNLKSQMKNFLNAAKTQNGEFNKELIEQEVKQVLDEAEERAQTIHAKSPFAFFMKKEMDHALEQYGEVVSYHNAAPVA